MAYSSKIKLYHFTDSRNIPSIKKHGLICWPGLLKEGIDHWPGSDKTSRSIDRRKGISGYVRLCATNTHPMASYARHQGRIEDIVWLSIGGYVINWNGVKFSDKNAVSNDATIGNNKDIFLNSKDVQKEVLVHGRIASRYILFP